MAQTKKGGKKGRKIGRSARKPKNARYVNGMRRFYNKIKRVRQSGGAVAAREYAAGPRHAKRYLARRGKRPMGG